MTKRIAVQVRNGMRCKLGHAFVSDSGFGARQFLAELNALWKFHADV